MALNLVRRTLPTAQLENALWEAYTALQRHAAEHPHLLSSNDYSAALKRAHKAWATVFQAMS